MELISDEPTKKSALKSMEKFVKTLQAVKNWIRDVEEDSEDHYDVEEMSFLNKILQYLNKNIKMEEDSQVPIF